MGSVEIDLTQVETFPVNMTSDDLWDKVVAMVGEKCAEDYTFCAWTGLKLNNCFVAEKGRFVISTRGGYSSEAGDFVGYVTGEAISLPGPACLYGDSDSPDAEFTPVSGSSRKVIFAVCRTR